MSDAGGTRIQGEHRARWLWTGRLAFAAMEQAIDGARNSVRLETYIYRATGPGERLRSALLRAARRNIRVSVLADSFGSESLPPDFFAELVAAGGRVRFFNPRRLLRLSVRDHRKILVCDDRIVVLGGMNIGPEYDGDGITSGWRDFALLLEGPVAGTISRSFDTMFGLAPLSRAALRTFAQEGRRRRTPAGDTMILTGGPGAGARELRRQLRADLRASRHVIVSAAYFVPPLRIRKELARVQARGGEVRVLVAGLTDVPIAQLAGRHLYARLLARGVKVYEYMPQILHAKLLVLDDIVYIGSCNLDIRSLHINYELLLRLRWPELAEEARAMFEHDLAWSDPVDAAAWRNGRGWWDRVRSQAAYWALARLDPLIAQRQLRALG